MFGKKKLKSPIQKEIDHVYDELKGYDPKEENYGTILERLAVLYKMQENEKRQVSPDTAVTIAANLIGILLVIRHEHVNVITSRAMSLITKTR
jgi:hypothetical protein